MHPNKAFRSATREQNLSFANERGFGVLSVNGPQGPLASHIPFVLSEDRSIFGAHLVRSNPILKLLEQPTPALMVVSGPDAYISPDWYELDDQVPTWNYVAVHLRGTLKRLPSDDLRAHLEALSSGFEKRLLPKPVWEIGKVAPEILAKFERMIVPVEFTIDRVDGTWKLGQNKPDYARRGAAAEVARSDVGQMIAELSELMNDAAEPQ